VTFSLVTNGAILYRLQDIASYW